MKFSTPHSVPTSCTVHRLVHTPHSVPTSCTAHRLVHTPHSVPTSCTVNRLVHTPHSAPTSCTVHRLVHTPHSVPTSCTAHRLIHTPHSAILGTHHLFLLRKVIHVFAVPFPGAEYCSVLPLSTGPHAWPIPVQNLPYPESLEKYKVFGQLMMEGKVSIHCRAHAEPIWMF